MSGFDAALLATSARSPWGWVGARQRTTVRAALTRLGVQSLASSRFSTLSGGQQQRLLLAGALAADPDILLLDEPTDGLDVHSRLKLLELLREFTSMGLATVIISHDVEDLLTACDIIARVHLADDAARPGRVELLTPDAFAAHLTATSTSHAHTITREGAAR
jgi:ABC-type Mn2+/Zn2+ transport system ATPase subunit